MIINISRDVLIAKTITVANNPFSRMKGLLGTASLPVQKALVITPCNSIHMLFMQFPIDVIFINKTNHVVGLVNNIPPFAFSPIFWESSCAIELPAGTIQQTQTAVGDIIQIGK